MLDFHRRVFTQLEWDIDIKPTKKILKKSRLRGKARMKEKRMLKEELRECQT